MPPETLESMQICFWIYGKQDINSLLPLLNAIYIILHLLYILEFFLNGFSEFNDIVITVKGLEPTTSHSASKTHVWDGIFKLSPIHASVIYQIRWIQWIPVPFRENSTVTNTLMSSW